MAKIKILSWNPAEHLETEEDIAAYLEAAQEYDDPDLMAAVLEDIERARAKGIVRGSEISAAPDGRIGVQPSITR